LLVVVNGSEDRADSVSIKANIPNEIAYKGNVKVDGNPFGGDIRDGINIGSLDIDAMKTITFEGQIKSGAEFEFAKNEIEVTGTVQKGGFFASDATRIVLAMAETKAAAAGLFGFSSLFRKWYFWPLAGIVAIFLFYWLAKLLRRKEA